MKRSKRAICARALLLALVAGCLNVEAPTTAVPESITIVLQPASTRMVYFGQTKQFKATIRDALGQFRRRPITWTSSDPSVFTVDDGGEVTAVGDGSAELRATAEGTTAMASVTVLQTPARIPVVSGGDQQGVAGSLLEDPIIVRVVDEGGNSMSGINVSFAPAEGSGSVSRETYETDVNGTALTHWTLGGGRLGRQSLSVVVGDVENRINAFAVPETPIPDLSIEGALKLTPEEPTDLEAVDITVVVANTGNAATPASFPLTLFVDGTPVETFEVGQLKADEHVELTYALGMLEAGEHEISVQLDSDGEIREWFEDNNGASRGIQVVEQRVVELGQPVTVSSNTVDDVVLFRVDIPEGRQEALNFVLRGGQGDPDLFVHFGDRPGSQYEYTCQSGGPATAEFCQLVPVRAGSYHVAVHAFSAFGPTTLTVDIVDTPTEPFDIDVRIFDDVGESRENVIREAIGRWESVIAQGVDRVDFGNSPFPGGECVPGGRPITGSVDDLLVLVSVDRLDGEGGLFANGQPCLVRQVTFSRAASSTTLQTAVGGIVLDEDDLARLDEDGLLGAVVSHNVAHVLGFGFQGSRLWRLEGLLVDPLLFEDDERDTHFIGPLATAAFEAAGGVHAGAGVPVENTGRPGFANDHWRESVFGTELMTGVLAGGNPPLSLVTIEALADMRYGVDLTQADEFTLPTGSASAAVARGGALLRPGADLGRYPIRFVDRQGGIYRLDQLRGK